MNDSAMQLMSRERREQFRSIAPDGASDIDARPLFRMVLGWASGVVWAIVLTAIALVINVHGPIPGTAQPATQASAPDTVRTNPGNGQDKLAKTHVSREGHAISLVSEGSVDKVDK